MRLTFTLIAADLLEPCVSRTSSRTTGPAAIPGKTKTALQSVVIATAQAVNRHINNAPL